MSAQILNFRAPLAEASYDAPASGQRLYPYPSEPSDPPAVNGWRGQDYEMEERAPAWIGWAILGFGFLGAFLTTVGAIVVCQKASEWIVDGVKALGGMM